MDYLLIGHILDDLLPDGSKILGGTPSYSGIVSQALGNTTRIVTSCNTDLSLLDGIDIHNIPTKHSTTFRNNYTAAGRSQEWLHTAQPIGYGDVPKDWYKSDVVHIAPMAGELLCSIMMAFPNSLTCVTTQGWLRGKTLKNRVIFLMAELLLEYLAYADIVVLSLEDCAGNRGLCDAILHTPKIGIETLGPQGCRVYWNNKCEWVGPAPKVEEIEPTGAGDVFAAALFTHYAKSGNILESADFANKIASLSVTVAGIPALKDLLHNAKT